MSEILAAKIKLNEKLESEIISEMLFSVVKEGCNRKIAIHILQRGSSFDGINIPYLALDEIIILFTDSYNRDLTNPLIGHDIDYEVKEYRAEPLKQRLTNIQEYLEFIFDNKNILMMSVIWDIEDLTLVLLSLWEGMLSKFLSGGAELRRFPEVVAKSFDLIIKSIKNER